MSTLGRQTIELWRPVQETTGDDDLQLEGHYSQLTTCTAWVKELSGDQALETLGTLTDTALRIRVRPRDLGERRISSGWRVVHDGNEYAVRSATQTGGLWNLLVERLG